MYKYLKQRNVFVFFGDLKDRKSLSDAVCFVL